MKNIDVKVKWLVLGYFLCFLTNGCDLGMGSDQDFEPTSSDGLGASPWNPVYVKIVE